MKGAFKILSASRISSTDMNKYVIFIYISLLLSFYVWKCSNYFTLNIKTTVYTWHQVTSCTLTESIVFYLSLRKILHIPVFFAYFVPDIYIVMNEICVYKINTRAGKLSFNPASTYLQGKQL